jgi:hypothetical protein
MKIASAVIDRLVEAAQERARLEDVYFEPTKRDVAAADLALAAARGALEASIELATVSPFGRPPRYRLRRRDRLQLGRAQRLGRRLGSFPIVKIGRWKEKTVQYWGELYGRAIDADMLASDRLEDLVRASREVLEEWHPGPGFDFQEKIDALAAAVSQFPKGGRA